MNDHLKHVQVIYQQWSGIQPISVVALPESGSYRRYFRITSNKGSVLGVYNNDDRENQAFIYLNNQLEKTGNRVPRIIHTNLDQQVYFEQDLGNVTLFDHLATIRSQACSRDDILYLYRRIIDAMPALQVYAARDLDYSQCYPRAEFDVQSMMWDMNYFKYCLLKPLKISFFEQDLEDDFMKIVDWLIKAERTSFMFRDFQSRNIMIHKGELFFIDFQGGRKGPLQYDLASLLFEAKTHLPEDVRQELLNYYLQVFSNTFTWFDANRFLHYYYGFVYLRLMQAMGAYGFRGYIERKPLFLQSLPYAVKTLSWLILKHPIRLNLKCLPEVFEKLINLPAVKDFHVRQDVLTVTINSFSYKNDIPQDHSGNGGGFVFDCRCLDNPGRYEEYKLLTGRDQPVIDFLTGKAGVEQFLNSTCSLVEQAIEVYAKRNFNHLMVSYGCTGGQHRSVYMAEQLATKLKNKFTANIVVIHHELEKKQSS